MANNKWVGLAQPRVGKKVFYPNSVSPGSLWKLRMGSANYQYEYPPSIVESYISEQERAKVVLDSVVSQISSSGLSGGSVLNSDSVSVDIVQGRWALVANGAADGAPIDVSLTVDESASSVVKVTELQVGSAGLHPKQIIRWPKTPTTGTLVVGYRDLFVSVAFNATSGTLQTALNTTIFAGKAIVTGNYTDGYTVEIDGSGPLEMLWAHSLDTADILSEVYNITEVGGLVESSFTLPKMDGNSETLWKFVYISDYSGHLFTGASNRSQVETALQSVDSVGAGNARVEQLADGSMSIVMVSKFTGTEVGSLYIQNQQTKELTELTATTGGEIADYTSLTITYNNLPVDIWSTGNATLQYGGVSLSVPRAGTMLDDINDAIDAYNLSNPGAIPWVATATSGGPTTGSPLVITFQGLTRVALGLIKLTLPSTGCLAIDVREIQAGDEARNSIQQVALHSDPDGGTFTLTFGVNTTSAIAYNATAAQVTTALEALASIGAGKVTVNGNDGGPWIVEFISTLGSQSLALIVGNGASLTIAAVSSVTTLELIAATGPNWWTNAKNWSLNHVPTVGDTVIFEEGSVPCIYGIENVPAFDGIRVFRTYSGGAIGLKEVKDDGTPQTLPQYLSLTDNGGVMPISINIGSQGDGPSIVRIDTQLQDATVTIPYSSLTPNSQLYAIGLAGALNTVNVGQASVGIAIGSTRTATVGTIRVSTNSAQSGGGNSQSVGWGPNAVVSSASVYRSSLKAESVPAQLDVVDSIADIIGSGAMNLLEVRGGTVQYDADGTVGRQGDITALAISGGLLLVTSASHGLTTGQVVFIRGLLGVDERYFTVDVVSSSTFKLVESAAIATYLNLGVLAAAYSSGVPGSPKWGLADTVRVGAAGQLLFGDGSRTVVAPILLQSTDSVLADPATTIAYLRWRCDPGFLTEGFGRKVVYQRTSSEI